MALDPNAVAKTPDLPSRPRRPLPPGACDCHSHIFGPFDRFPLDPERNYAAPLATIDQYWTVLRHLGFERAAPTHPAAHGFDPAALLDGIARHKQSMRGTAVAEAGVSDATLQRFHDGGIRGLRFSEPVHAQLGKRFNGSVGFSEIEALAPQIKALGWHAQLHGLVHQLAEAMPRLLKLGVPLVLDHLARVGPSDRKVDDPDFQALLGPLREGRIWVKLTVFRNSRAAPDYPDMRPFHDALLRTNPDRLVWGTDWPFVTMDYHPDLGHMLDLLDEWTGDDAIRHKILVDNPAALYGFA